MSESSVERVRRDAPDSVHPDGLVITEELIKQILGMELVVIFPHIESNGAGIVEHGAELERIGKLCGYGNVISSLYFDEGQLTLGIFAREGSIPRDVIETSSSDPAPAPPELG